MPENGRSERLRTWGIALIPLAVASTGGIWQIAQMQGKINTLETLLSKHEMAAAHGVVESRLTEHDFEIRGLVRSIQASNKANDRLSDRVTDLEKQRYDYRENP